MSEISKKIDEVIATGLKKLMKDAGFRKKGRTFYKEADGIFSILNVQASTSNNSDQGKFTVNLGMFFPAIHDLVGSFEVKGVPSEAECTLRKRIGLLMPACCDHWWSVKEHTNFKALTEELKNMVENLALPWLEKNKNISEAAPLLKNQNIFTEVATLIYEGNREEASHMLEIIISKGGHATSKAKHMAKKYGLSKA